MCNETVRIGSRSLRYVPDQYNAQEICDKAIVEDSWSLVHVKTQDICKKVVEKDSYTLRHVPGHLKTKKICEGAFEEKPWALRIELHSLAYVLDQYKTQEM